MSWSKLKQHLEQFYSIEVSLESHVILLNNLPLEDRRVGKKRVLNISKKIKLKHPASCSIFMDYGVVHL